MKGIVFTELMEMVEQQFGYETVDELLLETDLPSGGAYTAIGTYSHQEMLDLLNGLSKKTKTPKSKLLYGFGQHLFGTFCRIYGQFFEHLTDVFSFYQAVDQHIHVEVKKLYPDADLPNFQFTRLDERTVEMIYRSERCMGDLVEGLIVSAAAFFQEKVCIKRRRLDKIGKLEQFLISKA